MEATSLFGLIWIIISLLTLVLGIAAMFDIWARNLAGKGRAMFAIIVGTLPMLYVIIGGAPVFPVTVIVLIAIAILIMIPGGNKKVVISLGVLLLALVLIGIGIGISNFGSGRPMDNQKTFDTAVEFVEFVIRNEDDIYDWSKRDAERFGQETYWTVASVLGEERNGQIHPKPAFKDTYALLRLVGDRADDIRNADIYAGIPPRPRDRFQRELRELIPRAIAEIERAGGKVRR